jgi:hypothetical protein
MFILSWHLTQKPMLPLDSFSLKAACAVPRGVRPTAACAAHVLSVYKSLCCIWTCLSTRAFVLHLDVTCLPTRALSCTGRVRLQEPVVAPVRVCLQALCDAPGRVCLQEPLAAPVRVCLQELCDTLGHVCLQESSPRCTCRGALLRCIFRFVSKHACLFRLFRYMFETPKQTEKNIFLVS